MLFLVFAVSSVLNAVSNTNAVFSDEFNSSLIETNGFVSVEQIFSTNTNLSLAYLRGKQEEYTETPARRFEIIFLIGVPATYTLTKTMMDELVRYVYKSNPDRELNDTHWAYIIANTIIIPLVLAVEDYKRTWDGSERNDSAFFVPVFSYSFGLPEQDKGGVK